MFGLKFQSPDRDQLVLPASQEQQISRDVEGLGLEVQCSRYPKARTGPEVAIWDRQCWCYVHTALIKKNVNSNRPRSRKNLSPKAPVTSNVGALIISIGFGGNPQNPILIIN